MLLGWPRIEGRENLQGWSVPLLVVCNHDFRWMFSSCTWPYGAAAKSNCYGNWRRRYELESPAMRALRGIYDRIGWALGVSLLNLFPLPREAGFRQSFAYAGEAVDRGYSVLVFPEGRHTVDGRVNPFRAGIGLLANNLGIPVLPMRIVGLFELKQAGKKFALPGKIQVRIGSLMNFADGSDPAEVARQLQRVGGNCGNQARRRTLSKPRRSWA